MTTPQKFGTKPAATPEELAAEAAAQAAKDKEAQDAADKAKLAEAPATQTNTTKVSFDPDVNLSEGNQTTGVQGSLNSAQIMALQGLAEPSGPAIAGTATMPAGFYSVGKGSLRYKGKLYVADKIGGRFFYDPSKLPEGALMELASYIPSGVVFALDAEGNFLDVNGERT